MSYSQSRLVVTLLSVAATVCIACGQPASRNADESANPPAGPSSAPAQAPPQEQPPAVAQNAQQPAPPVQPTAPAPRREPARRKEPIAVPPSSEKLVEPPTAERPVRPVETAPAPEPIVKTLPAGTLVDLIILDGRSSETSKPGDSFRARVAQDISRDGVVVVPAGSVVRGEVTEAVPLKKIGGTAKVALRFSEIELTTGSSVPIEASIAEQGKNETKRDAATIGGAAAGGALLGRILGKGGKGALIGAIVGGAAGTAIAAKTKGEQVEIPVGTEISIALNRPVDVTLRR